MHLNYILLSDGSSDGALIPIIEDALLKTSKYSSFYGRRADLSRYPTSIDKLEDKIDLTLEFYNPDVIFIHRDAERELLDKRIIEIENGIKKSTLQKTYFIPELKIIPIRMTEAWLLIDENAIKFACGNPHSKVKLSLPRCKDLEHIPNPKKTLEDLIIKGSELSKRRLKKLNVRHAIQLVPRYIEDFSPLTILSSYQYFLQQIKEKLN